MGRRRNRGLLSVVSDVVHISSRLSWKGALLTGIIAYIVFSIILPGYIENIASSQKENMYFAITEVRLDRLVYVSNWVGIACFIASSFFAFRNYLIREVAKKNEKSIVTMLSKLIARSLD